MAQSRAQIQKSYRERLKKSLSEAGKEVLPSLPGVSSLPATRRWFVALDRSKSILEMVLHEMNSYFEDRSSEWQEGEKGEVFQEKIDSLTDIIESLSNVNI